MPVGAVEELLLHVVVRAERVSNIVYYSLAHARILDACHITREILLQQLTQQGTLAALLTGTREV